MAGMGIPNLSLGALMGQADAASESAAFMRQAMNLAESERDRAISASAKVDTEFEQEWQEKKANYFTRDIAAENSKLEENITKSDSEISQREATVTKGLYEILGLDIDSLYNSMGINLSGSK